MEKQPQNKQTLIGLAFCCIGIFIVFMPNGT